jgi:hypothetical protein
MKKSLILTTTFLLTTLTCAVNNNLGCPGCVSPVFEISLSDSTGAKLNGFTIKAINTQNETLSITDGSNINGFLSPDTVYELFINSGTYHLVISNQKYETIEMNAASASTGKCGVNPRILRIEPEAIKLAKGSASATYKLLLDSTGRGCGN